MELILTQFQPKENFKLPLEPVLRKVLIAFETKEHRAAEHFCTWRVEMTEKLGRQWRHRSIRTSFPRPKSGLKSVSLRSRSKV